MSRKETSHEECYTAGSRHADEKELSGISGKPQDPVLSSLKSSDKCVYDSKHSDSGVWSGSNIQSEEISVESPVSKSGDFNFMSSSEKVSSENKSTYMRLDSGIDVSQHFSELSLKDADSYNDLSTTSVTSKGYSSYTTNINEKFPSSTKAQKEQKYIPQTVPTYIQQTFLDQCFQQNEDGDTDLHLAIIHKFIETVFALVRMVPNPTYLNIRNDDRQTPLHLAVLTQQPRLVRLLVVAGAALDELDRAGNTPLHLAVQANNLACVRAILDPVSVPDVTNSQLQYTPLPPCMRVIANTYNYEGQTCLHFAALNGNVDIFRYLLWSGANINAREWKGGQTCLHLAVERKDLQLCVFLLGQELLDPEVTTYAGYTAYQTACCGWDANIAEALRTHGVDTYESSDTDSDDEMPEMSENGFGNSFQLSGNGLVNVGA